MRWFIVRGFVLLLALIAVLGLIIIAGRQQAQSNQISYLHLDDCELPCWIGIWPGKTGIAEARELINTAFASSPYYRAFLSPEITSNTLNVDLATGKLRQWNIYINIDARPDGIVHAVYFAFPNSGIDITDTISEDLSVFIPTVADFLNRFGRPSLVLESHMTGFVLAYGDKHYGAYLRPENADFSRWNLRITSLVLYDYGLDGERDFGQSFPWQGFKPLMLYGAQCPYTC
jgi:hypothetical protein